MEYKELKAHLKAMVNTESGRKVLAHLKTTYLLQSSVKDTVEKTYYELGKKELIQDLIMLMDNPLDLDNLTITITD